MKIYLSFILLIVLSHLHGQEAIYDATETHHPVVCKNGMVASQHYSAHAIIRPTGQS